MRNISALMLIGLLGPLPRGPAVRPPAGRAPEVQAESGTLAGSLIPVVFLERVENGDKSAVQDSVYRILPRNDSRVRDG